MIKNRMGFALLALAMASCATVKIPSFDTLKRTILRESLGGVERFEITQRGPAFGGVSIDGIGAYEMIAGVAHMAINPRDTANRAIVDLEFVPPDADGLVRYKTDLLIVRPVDRAKASGVSVFEIANRGNKIFIPRMNDAAAPQVDTAANAGHGWGLRQGHTWVWAGWQGDIKPGKDGAMIGTQFPIAKSGGASITGLVEEEMVFDDDKTVSRLPLQYPSANAVAANGTLTVRATAEGTETTIANSKWKYVDANTIELERAAGFDAGALYSFRYEAKDPMVNGVGFAVLRDVTRYLKTSDTSPLADIKPQTNLVVGISQSGRFLRDFIWYGFNANPDGGKVFDGAMSFIAGSRKSFVNTRFSQPGRYSRQHEDHKVFGGQFPFTYATTTDPLTSARDGIFAKCETTQTCPKLMHIDSTLEFWQARASLVVADGAGNAVPIPDDVRLYTMASTQHSAPPTASAGVCQTLNNPAKQFPTYRALFDALVQWTSANVSPPASNFPTLTNRGLVPVSREAMGFPDFSGYGLQFPSVINELDVIDYTKLAPQVKAFARYKIFVPKTDADGHDVIGVRAPDVDVPLATYTGFNVRKAGFAPGQLCGLNGMMVPLAPDAATRNTKRDSRLSIAERYPNRAAYVASVDASAAKSVAARTLLAEDAARFVEDAKREARVSP